MLLTRCRADGPCKCAILVVLVLGFCLLGLARTGYAARLAGEDKVIATSGKEEQKKASDQVPAQTSKETKKQPAPAKAAPHPSGPAVILKPSSVPAKGSVVVPAPAPPPPVPARTEPVKPVKAPAPSATPAARPGKVAAPDTAPVAPQPVPAKEPPKPAAPAARYVTVDFDNVDIHVLVKFISELTGKNFVIDEKVKGKVTILSPKKVSVDEAYKVFQSVLEVHGFSAVAAGDIIKIVPSQVAREKYTETLLEEERDPEDRIVTQIIPLEHASPDDMKKVLDPLVSRTSVVLSYPPTRMLVVTDVFSNIKRLLEIVGNLDVEGAGEQITYLPLKHGVAGEFVKTLSTVFQQPKAGIAPIRVVADERANSMIVVASEADSQRVRRLIDFMDREIPRGDTTLHVYRLQNSPSDDLAKVLMNIPRDVKDPAQKGKAPVISRDVQVVSDKATNTLIITASKDDYRTLEEVIKKLDIPRPMVFIEALIMEVQTNKDFNVGVQWSAVRDIGTDFTKELGGTTLGAVGFSGPGNLIPQSVSGVVGALPSGFSVGVIGTGIKIGNLTFPNIGAVLNAYQQDRDVSIIATPQILSLDNEEAEINISQNIPYVTRQERSAANIDYSNYEYKDVGTILKITPQINEENFLRLKIDQQVTRVLSQTTQVSPGQSIIAPTTLKRTAKTTVRIKNEETVVLGGLISDDNEETVIKIPCVGNIPILGWLFKYLTKKREKNNLFVFITPHIIRTPAEAAAMYKDKKEEIGQIQEGIIKMNEKKKPKPEVKEAKQQAKPKK